MSNFFSKVPKITFSPTSAKNHTQDYDNFSIIKNDSELILDMYLKSDIL